jgi:hypothetical protein
MYLHHLQVDLISYFVKFTRLLTIPAGVSGFFININSFRSHYGSGIDSVSDRNEYREYFLRGKGSRCVRLTPLPPSCVVFTKSGNLNFLETSGHVQACNGTVLPLSFTRLLILQLYKFSRIKSSRDCC